MAAKKKSYDIAGAVGDKTKKETQWREFADWINGKDAKGGKPAQDALAKTRVNKLMNQVGPDPIKRLTGVKRAASPAASTSKGKSNGLRISGPAKPSSGPKSRFK